MSTVGRLAKVLPPTETTESSVVPPEERFGRKEGGTVPLFRVSLSGLPTASLRQVAPPPPTDHCPTGCGKKLEGLKGSRVLERRFVLSKVGSGSTLPHLSCSPVLFSLRRVRDWVVQEDSGPKTHVLTTVDWSLPDPRLVEGLSLSSGP